MNLIITAMEVRAFKVCGVTVDIPAGITDADIEECICLVQLIIEQITGLKFNQLGDAATLLFDGNGETTLVLPCTALGDLITVNKIEIKPCGSDDWVELTNVVNTRGLLECCGDPCENAVPEDECDTCSNLCYFPKGCQTVRIDGIWGEPAPKDIKYAAIILVLEKICAGLSGEGGASQCEELGTAEVRKITWPDFSVTFAEGVSAEDLASGFSTGILSVDNILARNSACNIEFFCP